MSEPAQNGPEPSGRSGESRLRHLVEAYCNEIVSDDEFAELEQRLARDPAARGYYLRYMHLDSALAGFGHMAADAWTADSPGESKPARPMRLAGRIATAMAACAVVAAAMLAWLGRADNGERTQQGQQPPQMIAALKQPSGAVTVTGSDGRVRPARGGMTIASGDTLRTREPLSAATLVYPDGTRLSLVGNTSATCSGRGDRQKVVTVHGGTLFASVAAQPPGRPMRIVTHTDALEILGTRFTLDATTAETDLSVTEGRVRLTRLSDGKSVEVPAGQRVVSNAGSALALDEIPSTPDEWSVDFEDGLPDGWGLGKMVTSDAPTGSRAAVQSVRAPSKDGAPVEVATGSRWAYGLFAVHDDSHLHFTCKMHSPGWVNILISTRTAAGDPPAFAGNYILDGANWWPHQADRWVRVSIPLKNFRPLPPARGDFEGAVPFQLLFSSPEADRGLVIDRIEITRGGPGRVVTKELP